MSARNASSAGWFCVLFLLSAIGLYGCDDGTTQTSPLADAGLVDQSVETDVSPVEPDAAPVSDSNVGLPPLPTGMDVPSSAYPVMEALVDRWAVLRDGRVVSQTGSIFALTGAIDVAPDAEAPGDLLSAVLLDDTVLVLTTEGLFSWTDLGLETSPLDDLITAAFLLFEGQGQAGWFLMSTGLAHWTNGMLRTLSTGDLTIPWERAHVAAGHFRDAPTLWVAYDRTLIALSAGDTTNSWRFELNRDVRQMTTTGNGVYLLFPDRLTHLGPDETWTDWARPEGASLIGGHPDAMDLWISNGVTLWQLADNELRQRTASPVHAGLQVSAAGDVYLKAADGIHQVIAGRFINFVGLEDGSRLSAPTTVMIEATTPERVVDVSYQLDDAEPVGLEGMTWSVDLDPAEVTAGRHDFSVRIRYDDGGEIVGSISFLGPPSWDADISPLNSQKCAGCHGDGGSAHIMNDADAWRLEIAEIIDDVETGRMPYGSPMLPPEEVELIRAWRDTGMRQGQAIP